MERKIRQRQHKDAVQVNVFLPMAFLTNSSLTLIVSSPSPILTYFVCLSSLFPLCNHLICSPATKIQHISMNILAKSYFLMNILEKSYFKCMLSLSVVTLPIFMLSVITFIIMVIKINSSQIRIYNGNPYIFFNFKLMHQAVYL